MQNACGYLLCKSGPPGKNTQAPGPAGSVRALSVLCRRYRSRSGRQAARNITAASANASAISKYRLRSKNTTIRSLLIMTALPARLLQCMPVDRPVMFWKLHLQSIKAGSYKSAPIILYSPSRSRRTKSASFSGRTEETMPPCAMSSHWWQSDPPVRSKPNWAA